MVLSEVACWMVILEDWAGHGIRMILHNKQSCLHNWHAEFFVLSSENVRVPVSKRARFVGPGGYNLRKLQAQTGNLKLDFSWIRKGTRNTSDDV